MSLCWILYDVKHALSWFIPLTCFTFSSHSQVSTCTSRHPDPVKRATRHVSWAQRSTSPPKTLTASPTHRSTASLSTITCMANTSVRLLYKDPSFYCYSYYSKCVLTSVFFGLKRSVCQMPKKAIKMLENHIVFIILFPAILQKQNLYKIK